MSAIFISHSSQDVGIAVEIQDWLVAQGHEAAFLDYDPENGIPAGRNWEKELYAQLRACRVILVLWSANWRTSKWCFAELTHARAQGKYIIPLTIDGLPVDELVLRDTQAIDWNADRKHASTRLSRALVTAGLDQQEEFAWDSRRSPYPGMVPFELNDAGVFFGRDQAIQEGLDRLSQLQRFGPRLLLLLGASGTGKSSLVRAGLVPRLRRDRQGWLVLDPIRPVPDPWHQLALAIHERCRLFQPTHDWRALRDALQAAQNTALETARVLTDVFADLMVGSDQRQSTVFLAIDQAEELFTAIPPEAAATFLDVLRYVLSSETPAVVAVAVIRSDLASLLQDHPAVREIRLETMVLGSLRRQGYAQMIEGPARRAGLRVEPALVQAMLQDAHTSAAMPLLAFSLRELWDRLDLEGTLTLAQYQKLGGLTGAIAGFAGRVIASHALSPQQEIAVRAAFLTLVSVDEEAKFRRRPAHWDELPADAHPLLERFITARLLVSFPGDHGERVVEVAHEALFTAWPLLSGWLEQYRVDLKTREDVERASREWHARGRDASYLVHHGRRLKEASALERDRDVRLRRSESEYLEACRALQQSAAEDSVRELAEAGWGVVFPEDTDDGILTALQPLLQHRKSQATLLRPDGYREFIRRSGYRAGETGAQFLWRHGVAPGVSDRGLVPHYLLLVGDPETIPFDFQYQLCTTNAVGRVHFGTHAEYAAYARSVIEAESGLRKRPRRITVFAPANAADTSMRLTVLEFANPLARAIAGNRTDWSVDTRLGQSATKAELRALLGGAQTPAVLYLVAHGLTYPKDDPRQLDAQGGLLCSDWKGGTVASESVFAADDVSADASMTGMIGFLIGEYTGGTPRFAERVFIPRAFDVDEKPIAPHAFVAPLFRRLLGHPGGGALALVGHVERTWAANYSGGKAGHEVGLFARVIDRLLQGEPLGAAMRPLFQRYAEYSASLSRELESLLSRRSDASDVKWNLLTEFYDARNYIIVGDPAVRVCPEERATSVTERNSGSASVVAGSQDDFLERGWVAVLPEDDGDILHESLRELLEHRRNQFGARAAHRHRVLSGETSLRAGESPGGFLDSRSLNPSGGWSLPPYLLLVGGMDAIPYEFELQLAATHPVGRLDFADLNRYRHYARGVIEAEVGNAMPRRALFFRPEYDGEERFNSISSTLLTSLANGLEREAWHVDRLVGELASKRGLEDWLNEGGHPLLFVIAQSAGIGSSSPHALLCHGYPTRKHSPSNAVDRCFTADDVSPGARLAGLVAFLFTSRGLGTHTRVAPLAQALLGHRNGGTLAVIGTYEHLTVKPYIAPAIAGSSEKDELPLSEYHGFFRRLTTGQRLGLALRGLQSQTFADSPWRMLGDPAVRLSV